MSDPNLISIAHLCPQLDAAYSGALPSYRRLYFDVLSGKIPAENINGRWFVRRSDLPAIGKAFGMTPKVTAPKASAA